MSKQSYKDHSSLCAFTFEDGRRCTLPESRDDMGLCYFHARKHIERIRGQAAGREISRFLDTDILTACDLSSALSKLFAATAQGYIKPKTASTLAYLGQLMLQVQPLARTEFLRAYEAGWNGVVQESVTFADPDPDDDSEADDSAEAEPDDSDSDDASTDDDLSPSVSDDSPSDDSTKDAHSATA